MPTASSEEEEKGWLADLFCAEECYVDELDGTYSPSELPMTPRVVYATNPRLNVGAQGCEEGHTLRLTLPDGKELDFELNKGWTINQVHELANTVTGIRVNQDYSVGVPLPGNDDVSITLTCLDEISGEVRSTRQFECPRSFNRVYYYNDERFNTDNRKTFRADLDTSLTLDSLRIEPDYHGSGGYVVLSCAAYLANPTLGANGSCEADDNGDLDFRQPTPACLEVGAGTCRCSVDQPFLSHCDCQCSAEPPTSCEQGFSVGGGVLPPA